MFWRFSAICTASEVNYENFDLVTITSQAEMHLENLKKKFHKFSRWWFQIFFIFTPTSGNDPI